MFLLYAKHRFDDYQMKEIRLGLSKGIDVSTYADDKFDDYQMAEIREKLKEGK